MAGKCFRDSVFFSTEPSISIYRSYIKFVCLWGERSGEYRVVVCIGGDFCCVYIAYESHGTLFPSEAFHLAKRQQTIKTFPNEKSTLSAIESSPKRRAVENDMKEPSEAFKNKQLLLENEIQYEEAYFF